MATVTYTDLCPACALEGNEVNLMGEIGSDDTFCASGHKFLAAGTVDGEPVVEIKPLAMAPPPEIPAPVERDYPPTPTPEEVRSEVEERTVNVVKPIPVFIPKPPALKQIEPDGGATFVVKLPELAFTNLKAEAEIQGVAPSEAFQNALDWAFECQWFESIGWRK